MIFPSQITMTPDGGVPAVASSSHDVAADYGGSPMLPHELCRRWSGAQAKQDNVGDNRRPQGCPKKWKGDADHRDEEAADYGGSPVDFWLPHVLSRRGSGAQAKPDNVAGDRRPQGCLRKWKSDADRRDEEAGDYCGSPVDFRLPHVFCRRESGAQAKPDNVEDDRRPQGYPKKWQYDADRCPQGVDFPFLPHMIIGRRVPSPAPKTPPPSEVLQLPTAFRVPIPRDLPPGPWLPEEMTVPTTVLSRGEDSGYQNPSVNDGSQRNPPHEQRDGVSVDEGAALFPINMTNPCSPGRDRRSNPNNGGVGYQKRTTGCISDVGIGRGRFCNRSKDNDSRANYVHIQERRVIGNRHYEYLQKNNLQDCQVSKTQPIAQRNPLLNSIAKQKVKGQWVAVTKDEKHNLEARKQNGNKVEDDDLLPNGFLVNDTDQDGGCLEEQTKEHVDGNEKPTADGTPFVDDLTSDVVEGHSSTTEPGSQEDMEDFMFKIGAFAEEDLLDKFLADSLILNEKSSSFKHAGLDSVGKDLVSSSSRRIFRRSVHCRSDIENSTPHFLSVYRSLVLPAERESYIRNQLLCSLAQLAKEEWSNAQLHLFGSCANSFGLPSSDMDVCLSIDDTDMTKQNILLKLTEILQANNFQAVEAIANARIPIVKMLDPKSDISCDICINNLLAVANTKLLRDYAQIDDRLHQLAFIVKHWAKLRGVNNTYQGTLSSYAYVLMCIHFLQLRKPAILPCLQEMKATYFLNVDGVECAYFDHVETLHDFGAQNNESIARLVWEFFHYWAYIHDYVNHVISVRTGRLISKKSKNWTKRVGKDRHLLCIEDPFETSHDLGRVVDKCTISVLREEFERAADILQCDPKPWHTLFE